VARVWISENGVFRSVGSRNMAQGVATLDVATDLNKNPRISVVSSGLRAGSNQLEFGNLPPGVSLAGRGQPTAVQPFTTGPRVGLTRPSTQPALGSRELTPAAPPPMRPGAGPPVPTAPAPAPTSLLRPGALTNRRIIRRI
jgi:hypothetical protein